MGKGGIATPAVGIATPVGGIHTPTGIATPTGVASIAAGIRSSVAEEGILTADIIRAQLRAHAEKDQATKAAAGQKETKGKKKKKNQFKF